MKFNFKKDILPHLVAVIVFFIVTVLFYSPLFLTSKGFSSNDVLQGIGGGQEAIEFRAETGDEALWINSMFGGMPAYLINIRWSGDLLEYVQKVLTLQLPSPASVTFIAFISFYILLLAYKVRPYLAITGALVYGLNSFNMVSIEAGHIWKVRAIAYMPLVLAGFRLLFEEKSKKIFGAVLIALALALEIKANHLQITYYLMLVLIVYGISTLLFAVREKAVPDLIKNTGILLIAVLLGVGCNFGKLWATYEYGNFSTRGKSDLTSEAGATKSAGGLDRDYVFHWSSGKIESMTFLIPNFHGGASQQALSRDSNLAKALRKNGASSVDVRKQIEAAPTYWGDQPGVAGPVYLGAIVCFLFVLGIVVVDSRHRNWLLAATVFSLILSWGKNFEAFNYFMFDFFPAYSKFRSVSMAVVGAALCVPLLGFLGLESWLQMGTKNKQKKLLIAVGVVGGVCMLAILLSGMGGYKGAGDAGFANAPGWFMKALREDRASLLRGDAFRSMSLILLFAGALYFHFKSKVSEVVLAGLALLLMTSDLFMVDRRYINDDNYERSVLKTNFAKTAADQRILSDKGQYRVMNLQNPWSDGKTSYHHSSVGGYHGAKPKRYQELIEYCLDNEKNTFIQGLQNGSVSFEAINALNMINTKYFKFGPAENNVIPNANAFGNAWLASSVTTVNSANEEIAATCSLQSKNEAIVDASRFTVSTNTSGQGLISLADYKPNHLTYAVSAQGNSLAVFSEMYYDKGWVAFIDNKEVPIIRANYVLRALEVPAGEHTIEFEFKPAAYYVGNKVMLGSSALLLLMIVSVVVLGFGIIGKDRK